MPTGKYKRTAQTKQNISLALRGKPKPWQEKEKFDFTCPCGKHFILTKGQIRKGHGKFCSRPCYYKYRVDAGFPVLSHAMKGEGHWNYKGDKAGYKALHLRVNEKRGRAKVCEVCTSEKSVEWANLTGKYTDIYDYKSMCRSCHKNYDNKRRGGEFLA